MKWYLTEENIRSQTYIFITSVELANKCSILKLMTNPYLLR